MRYDTSLRFNGDPSAALEGAIAPLTALGFRIVERGPTSIDFAGPGMNSSRQSALLGATRIRLIGRAQELALEAELGGVEFMSKFVRYFPLGLSAVLFIVLALVFSIQFGDRMGTWWLWPLGIAVGANMLMWLLLGPWMARRMKARTCEALDALLNNIAVLGGMPST